MRQKLISLSLHENERHKLFRNMLFYVILLVQEFLAGQIKRITPGVVSSDGFNTVRTE